ncbi:D-malate degradation protein R [Hartmannibacter diazotrophicus]|uniref:D-malate degradation protein R n=1 Tax=Hartmannibacter diazotrophicus TaxID=1482074 RepID=A0A2C9D1A2_9HYPH|nr:LysR family transcriptional regulator [Hartmannibacter diazotrophicus]SON54003.1 D-malate degradation protein R [Hartmannibacter diazotrophicus]
MSELTHIRVFLAVAEQRSFVAAARQLAMTAPSVTRAVNALEEQLGLQLFLRTTRQVSLTSAGAVYAARLGPLVAAFDEAAEEVRAMHDDASGPIRINAPLSFGQQILPDIATDFRAAHPKVTLSLSLTDRFIDILTEPYDLAIRISGPPKDKSTIWRKICRVRRVMVASPSYLAIHGTPQSPEDLDPHACLAYDPDALSETWDLTGEGRTRKVRAAGHFAGNNGELIARMAEKGEGIALLPLFIVEEALAAGTLAQVLPGWEAPELWLTLYYPPYDRLPIRVAKFSDFFEDYVTRIRPL